MKEKYIKEYRVFDTDLGVYDNVAFETRSRADMRVRILRGSCPLGYRPHVYMVAEIKLFCVNPSR